MAASISPYPCTASGQLIKVMDNVIGNCTSIKANITVKAIFDGKQSGEQAFMKLIWRKKRTNGSDKEINNVGKTTYSIDKTQYKSYTKDSEAVHGELDVNKSRKEKHNPDGAGDTVKIYLWVSKKPDIMGQAPVWGTKAGMDIPCRPERTGGGTAWPYHRADESRWRCDRGDKSPKPSWMSRTHEQYLQPSRENH